jgi:hypothetical protein
MFTGREFSETSNKAYWAWSYKHLEQSSRETENSRTCFNSGFYLGAQYALKTSGELSPHVARFIEFIMWLTERAENDEKEQVHSVREMDYLSPPY